jgi:ribokinase
MAPPHISVVGSANVDLSFRTARLPRVGETVAGQAFHLGFGGKGANQAVMAARLGARVTLVGKVGRDVFGEQTLAHYRAEGVDTTHLAVDPDRPSGTAAIVVDDEARNCIIIVPGANAALAPADVRAAAAAIGSADVLLCQLEVPVETTLEAFRVARAGGVRTVLNPAPAAPLPPELLALADLCIPNETETELLTGQAVTTPAEAEAAARALLRQGPRAVLITLGSRGVLLADAAGVEYVPALPVAAVDPTGAGDAFIGALAVSLASGLALRAAAHRANAVAALSVTRLGAQSAFPRREEVEAFLAGAAAGGGR